MLSRQCLRLVSSVCIALLAQASHAQNYGMWAQGENDDAIEWSGAKSDVEGGLHSNGGIYLSGSQNTFTGGFIMVYQQWV